MASLKEIADELETYLKKKSKDSERDIATVNSSEKTDPLGKIQNSVKKQSVTAVSASVAKNPIQQMGTDLITRISTNVAQKLINSAFKKINLSAITNAAQGFFQSWAAITTFGTEVAMELARNAGKKVIQYCDEKDKIIADLLKELIALHNACSYLLNASPFLDAYIKDLIEALSYIKRADGEFLQVVNSLGRAKNPTYPSKKFDNGVKYLESAQKLILPDNNIDVSSIRGVQNYVNTDPTIKKTVAQAKAAALAIPGISLNIGKLVIKYVTAVVNLNLSIIGYREALSAWITSYSTSNTLFTAMIAHIQSGRAQMATLMNDMDAVLYPKTAVDTTSLSYTGKLTSSAMGWGMRNQGVIEWMKINPGKQAGVTLSQTQSSVDIYKKSIAEIATYGDIKYSGVTLPVNTGAEDAEYCISLFSKLLLKVNTIVAKRQTAGQITAEFKKVENSLRASLQNSTRIKSSVSKFIATPSTLSTSARRELQKVVDFAKKNNLDRAAELIAAGRVKDIAALTPDTVTREGAVLKSLTNLIVAAKGSPMATDAQIERLQEARSLVEADKTTKEIEAGRSYSNSADAARTKTESKLSATKVSVGYGVEVTKQLDAETGQTYINKAESSMGSVIPGFNNNNLLSKV